MPSYNERLTTNNQKIDDITTLANELPDADEINEKIDAQDTIIENLKSALDEKAGKGGGEPNIFVQLEEPTTKKGIWLQKEAEPEHYTYDEEVFIGGEWEPDRKYRSIPYNFYKGGVATVGTNIYIFGGEGASSKAYKYDTLTNTYTQLTNIPYSFSSSGVIAIDDKIYLFGSFNGSSKAYKYDTLTNTYTQLANISYNFYQGSVVAIGTDIYLLGCGDNVYSKYLYKYDTLTNTYTKMTNIPYTFSNGYAISIASNIYILGGSAYPTTAYKYDSLTNTYTQLANIPYDFYYSSACAVGTNIYLFGGYDTSKSECYKYDTLTNTYTKLTDIPYYFYNGDTTLVNNKIYLFGGDSNKTKVQCYAVESKTYEQDNLVVINQGKYSNVGYEIELYSNPKNVNAPKYAFADAWFYTIQDGLITNIPTYYGDGTRWINIKNPIIEEVEG